MWIRESSDQRWEKIIYHWPGLETNNGLWWLWLRGTMSFLALMEEMVSVKSRWKIAWWIYMCFNWVVQCTVVVKSVTDLVWNLNAIFQINDFGQKVQGLSVIVMSLKNIASWKKKLGLTVKEKNIEGPWLTMVQLTISNFKIIQTLGTSRRYLYSVLIFNQSGYWWHNHFMRCQEGVES